MAPVVRQWWRARRIQVKIWTVLLLLCLPLALGLSVHLYFVQQLLSIQHQRHELMLADRHVSILRRLAVDIEDGFRGYVLTQQPAFLTPLIEAEARIDEALANAKRSMTTASGTAEPILSIERRLRALLQSKRELIAAIQQGQVEKALTYVRSGEGFRLSDQLRQDIGALEDSLKTQGTIMTDRAESLSEKTFGGLWVALVGLVALGWIGSRMLARSVTDPLRTLQTATTRFGENVTSEAIAGLLAPVARSADEIGQLAVAYLAMARRIEMDIREIEALDSIGHEINTIGPDGLDGVLRRITDRAVELVQADVCLVLVRDDRMGSWIVEAASGEWNDRLQKSVMLWEELPVSARAFETGQVSIGEHFHSDQRPQVVRRNLIGDSMLAIPLMSQGSPFGVLCFLSTRSRSPEEWNQRLAIGLAEEAALAISNARLYEAAQQTQKGLLARLRYLEQLAESLAHDLKGPGARMEELARLLGQRLAGLLDDRAAKWLQLIQDNGRDIVQRVEGILEVARVGVGQSSVTAVDPRMVVDNVLKARAGEMERLRATVRIASAFPLVACHEAYLRQVFDNLISNALKFARPGEPPSIEISAQTEGHMVLVSVTDRGIGIPPAQRRRVFDPFVRLAMSPVPGSGIGLTIVQRIVELYGGRVWIDEGGDGGCTVRFTLPRVHGVSATAPLVASPAERLDGSDVGEREGVRGES